MEFRILGPLEVLDDGGVSLAVGSGRERAVLALLLLSANRVVSSERLADDLWGDRPPEGTHALRVYVSRLRKALREAGGDGVLVTRAPGYVVRVEPGALDAARFEALLARGREEAAGGDHAGAAETLRAALALWRGPALADVADAPFARAEAARLEEARLAATEERVEADLACGRHGTLAAELDALTRAHPLRERLWAQRMVALYRSGRQAEALRAYHELRGILGEELGLEPSAALARLEGAVLRHDPELDWPPAPPSGPRVPVSAPAPAGVVNPKERDNTGLPPAQPHEDRRRRPGDTLAFLFSDIEASTRRWEGDRDAMAENLTRHDELLQAAVIAHDGRVFAHTGDGLCSVFSTASSALAAAVSAQRSLLAENWGAPGPLRVRMAVHAGAAEPRGDNYAGPTLNRAARLLSTSHGGQVVCSQAAADLGWDELPKEITLLDLGEHRLADLARLERVFQVAHPDLPSAFPPLRSLDAHRHNLPVALTSFVGRERELAELEALLGTGRLLTLTGVGGAGKTRLALQLATRSLGRFPEGVFLVDLTPLRDPGLVAFEVAASLEILASGVGAAPGALEERVCEYLEPRRALLLLDNCEHVVQAVASLVDALLRRCPDVVVVATSRELLGVVGEVAWAVPSLSLPPAGAARPEELAASDAASLFCARAQVAKPSFAVSATNATAVAEICWRLDGIPLALELACARLRLLSAEQVASRLDDAFRLLTGGARTALPRHQTLRATMDWSYELLPPAEQAALRRLAVFPGSFDLEAAEAVVGSVEGETPAEGGCDVLDLLAHLVDKSLVRVESEGAKVRYRLLETVRQYAGEKLARAGETGDTRRRHRGFYLARGERWHPWGDGGVPLDGTDDDSFRVALEWSLAADDADASLRLAAALWFYWLYSGYELEGCAWLERCLATPPQPHIPARAASLIGLANLSLISGHRDIQQAKGLFDEALGLAVELDDREAESVAQRFLAVAALEHGDANRAKELAGEALTVSEASGLFLGAGYCHHTLGWVAMARGDAQEARGHFERAVEIGRQHEEAGEAALTCHALAALAPLVAYSGEVELADALADQSVEAARRLRLRQLLVMTLVRSAEAAILTGGGERAEAALSEALRLLGDLGARRWVADTLEMTALAQEARGDPASAAHLLGACDALRQALDESPGAHRFISSKVRGCRHRIAQALGAEAYAEQRTQGQRLSVPEAISYALSELSA